MLRCAIISTVNYNWQYCLASKLTSLKADCEELACPNKSVICEKAVAEIASLFSKSILFLFNK